HVAGFDGFAVAREQRCAVRHLVTLALAAVLVMDQHLAAAGDRDELGARIGYIAHARRVTHDAGRLALDLAHDGGARCGAANVESAHRELRARLPDRLRGYNAYRLTDVD